MEGDATTPPSRARLALAWRVGLRPWSPRLVPALICLALAAALPRHLDARLATALRATWSGRNEHVLNNMVLSTWSIVVVVVTASTLVAAAVGGGLGWVEGGRRRLGRVGPVRPGLASAVVGAAVLVALVLALRGVIAGAARGVDASEAGLTTLWVEWARRALLAAGLVSLAAAVIEVVALRAALRRALYQTRAEARECR